MADGHQETIAETERLFPAGPEDGNDCFALDKNQLCGLFEPDKSVDVLRKLGGTGALVKALEVNVDVGLCTSPGDEPDNELARRARVFGVNRLPEAPIKSIWTLIWEAYQDKTLTMLSVAAIISLVIGLYEDFGPHHDPEEPRVKWIEGVAILVAVVVVVLTNAVNDHQKEKQFRKLNAKKDDRTVKVVRNGHEQEISVFALVVGDVLLLEPGDIVPVDGVLLAGHGIQTDESSATGESDAIKKRTFEEVESGGEEAEPLILSGSKVLEGVGRMLVVAVGKNSCFGRTMMAMRCEGDEGDEHQETPLQGKLDELAESIAKIGVSAALLMLMTLTGKYFIMMAITNQLPALESAVSAFVQIMIQAITIVVVAVPEGLPMAVTLALAYATTQMIKDNNLVRVLAACETMGNATTVCTDKTGTLTQNVMTVVAGSVAETEVEGKGEGGSKEQAQDFDRRLPDAVRGMLIEAISVNSTAFAEEGGGFVGSKTECALLGLAARMGHDYQAVRNRANIARQYPFSSLRKTMTTVVSLGDGGVQEGGVRDGGIQEGGVQEGGVQEGGVRDGDVQGGRCRMHVKGASEIVLAGCNRYLDREGQVRGLDRTTKERLEKTIAGYAERALRTLCLAYTELPQQEVAEKLGEEQPLPQQLVCLAIVGIQDPLRPGVAESVRACQKAGVTVRMITGDNLATARAIAKEAGILRGRVGMAITGPELREMPQEERDRVLPQLQVLARSSPTDKQIVVRTLQRLGEVVAMTGDGTNDGPALKMADVGFGMGITGTEVAKEASAIVLMDDNFNSIVSALRWGRAVNESVRKFIQFQLTVNITAVVLAFASAAIDSQNQSVLSAVQLLWVNLIMDTLAALALATEPPRDELLRRYPSTREAPLVTSRMWKMIIGQALFQIATTLFLLQIGPQMFHLDVDTPGGRIRLRTLVFNAFVFLQVFNQINCRRINDQINVFNGLLHNSSFLAVQLVVILGQVAIVQYGGVAFGTVPLRWYGWLATLMIGALALPIGLVLRLLPDIGPPEPIHVPPKFEPSREQIRWDAAIKDVKTKLRVFKALRRVPTSSPKSRTSSLALACEGRPVLP